MKVVAIWEKVSMPCYLSTMILLCKLLAIREAKVRVPLHIIVISMIIGLSERTVVSWRKVLKDFVIVGVRDISDRLMFRQKLNMQAAMIHTIRTFVITAFQGSWLSDIW